MHITTLEETFIEERSMGMCDGPFTLQEAANLCRCRTNEIICGALGAVEEADKVRTIYDGTVGGQNGRIQHHIKEKTTSPTVQDAMHAIHWCRHNTQSRMGAPSPTTKLSILKADVTKAHRRIMILPNEWKFQVAKIGDHYWVNKVGTYGMASAQYHWGRMAAILIRILYKLFPDIAWIFVYVDDFAFILDSNQEGLACAALMTLIALGCPLSWHKTAIGDVNTWLGFQLDCSGPYLQVGHKKLPVILGLLQAVQEGKNISKQVLNEILGRLQWATSCAPFLRPFLQPWWEWFQAVQTSGRPGILVRHLAAVFMKILSKPYRQVSPFAPYSKWWGASDASANDTDASIGGWFTDNDFPLKSEVWWFREDLTQANTPWLFDKPTPQRRIASFELLGTLCLFQHLIAVSPPGNMHLHVPLMTDNQGNALSILNNNSKKWPTSAILMELVTQAHIREVAIAASHIKRSRNKWADDLADNRLQGFTPDKRVSPFQHTEQWKVLGDMTGLFYHKAGATSPA
jgi:hypothetical protein